VIAGIVLGAGQGLRIGQPKAWLRTDKAGECFFARACALLATTGAHPIVGVIGPGAERRARLAAPGITVVVNDRPEQGQLSSLQKAIETARPLNPEAVVVLPVDVPLVTASTVDALIDRWRRTRAPVVRPVSAEGRHGHPVVLASSLFDALLRADLDAGAKPVVRAHASASGDVLVVDEGAFFDVDTIEDYVRAFGRLPQAWVDDTREGGPAS
jgi:molybdenum cofactor cytidylyltransferase